MRREPLQEQQEIPQKVLPQKIRCQREKQGNLYNKKVKKRKLYNNIKGRLKERAIFFVCKIICVDVYLY